MEGGGGRVGWKVSDHDKGDVVTKSLKPDVGLVGLQNNFVSNDPRWWS